MDGTLKTRPACGGQEPKCLEAMDGREGPALRATFSRWEKGTRFASMML